MLEGTMKNYIVPVVCILAMLLRNLWSPQVDDLNFLLSDLIEMLQENAQRAHIIQKVHAVLLKMWTTSWPTQSPSTTTTTHAIMDPTETGLALLTLNEDGSLKQPKDVTKIIAKLEYCMRLTFLKEIRASASTEVEQVSMACDALQPWFTEKNYSTFARLRSLQHRASAIAYDTMGLPHIWWTDTKDWMSLKYKGNSITFSDVRSIFQDIEQDLITVWEDKILRGLPLRVDYADADLVDDLTNKDVGYSFLFDAANTCFQDRSHLVRAIAEGQGNFSRFLLTQDEHSEEELLPIWNHAALRGWLQDYAELQKLLLLRVEMLSGAPGRGTELTALTYRNTQTQTTRNLMMFGQHVTLLCQYSKTTALTGQDKLIPHGLDAITSDILIQDLAMARPFAQLAAKICFQDDQAVQLYKDMLFVNFNRLFTSKDLSVVMSKYSLPRIQFALTINPWRHIQTAWKRKFKCTTELITEMDKEEDVEALQAGHTRATENRIYGLSTQSLAGAAEDVLPLFLQASISWQKHCQVVPGGKILSYQQARSSSKHNLALECAPPSIDDHNSQQH